MIDILAIGSLSNPTTVIEFNAISGKFRCIGGPELLDNYDAMFSDLFPIVRGVIAGDMIQLCDLVWPQMKSGGKYWINNQYFKTDKTKENAIYEDIFPAQLRMDMRILYSSGGTINEADNLYVNQNDTISLELQDTDSLITGKFDYEIISIDNEQIITQDVAISDKNSSQEIISIDFTNINIKPESDYVIKIISDNIGEMCYYFRTKLY